MENILETKTGIKVLIYLRDNENICAHKISLKLGLSYSHLNKIIKILDQWKLIKCHKSGRSKFIKLTESGRSIADSLIKIKGGKQR